jgi:hypothetical protein
MRANTGQLDHKTHTNVVNADTPQFVDRWWKALIHTAAQQGYSPKTALGKANSCAPQLPVPFLAKLLTYRSPALSKVSNACQLLAKFPGAHVEILRFQRVQTSWYRSRSRSLDSPLHRAELHPCHLYQSFQGLNTQVAG